MADTIATLDIQINSTAKGATDAITRLQSKIGSLNSALGSLGSTGTSSSITNVSKSLDSLKTTINGIDKEKLKGVSTALNGLARAVNKIDASTGENITSVANALKGLSEVKVGDISGVSRLLRLVGKIDGESVGNVSSLFSSISTLAGASPTTDFSGVIKLLNVVKKVDSSSATVLRDIATAIRAFSGTEFTNLSGITSMLNSLRRISSATFDPHIFENIGISIRTLASSLVGTPKISENLLTLLKSIARFGSAGMASAPEHIDAIGDAIARMATYLDALPEIREDILRFAEAIASISPHIRTLNSATSSAGTSFSLFDTIVKAAKDTLSEFGKIGKSVAGTIKNFFKSLTSGKGILSGPVGSMLQFAATFFTIQRAWEALKNSISNASALVEIQNVINATYTSSERLYESVSGTAMTAAEYLDELANSAINAYGMSELAFKQYASRFQAMATALSITDEQVQAAEQNLSDWGVMVSKVKDPVTGLNKEFGTMTGQMSDLSMTLTQLAGDMASFYDEDVADVQKALASGIFGGQTRPLRQFGLDLTQANLQSWALSQGIDANTQSMTQGEKVMLRYQYILSNLGFVMGDFAYTADKHCVA